MSLLPSTWSAVGVDSDGDGQRNPQDIDDAALGAAVLLCSESGNLKETKQLRAALRGFNPIPGYAALVLALARSFGAETVPTPTIAVPGIPGPTGPLLPSETAIPGIEAALTSYQAPTPSAELQQPEQPTPSDQPTPSPTPTPTPTPSPSPPYE